MKELFLLISKLKIKELFIIPTDNNVIQFFRYAFVGGIASVMDWGSLFLIESLGVYYLLAAAFAFIIGLLVNFILSKKLVFSSQKSHFNLLGEFLGYAVIGIIGLGLTMLIMSILTEKFKIYFMVSKIVATIIVLLWNYAGRKLLIYKKDNKYFAL